MFNNIITIDPEIQSGSPVFSGTRVPVKTLFYYISTGESIETYLEDYPYITKEQVSSFMNLLSRLFFQTTNLISDESIIR
jgi:uncharacterized protein (DUF433 family)